MAEYLVNLDWNERTGNDYGEPLRPTLFQPQTNPLSKEQSRVDEAHNSETLDLIRTKISRLLECATNVLVAWIKTQHRDPMLQNTRHILVKQLESAYADCDHKNSLE